MKFFESTSFFLRVVIAEYTSHQNSINIKLIPMFHVGEKEFYDNIIKEANNCDIIIYEGFNLNKSRITKQLGRYTKMAKDLNMVSQFEYLPISKIQSQKIKADLSGDSAKLEWNKLKLTEKIKYRLINPIKFWIETQNLTRHKLSKVFMSGAQEANLAYGDIEEEGNLEYLYNNAREQFIITQLNRLLVNSNHNKTIGIMYGAGHMRRVETYLTSKFGYKIAETKFVIVYNL